MLQVQFEKTEPAKLINIKSISLSGDLFIIKEENQTKFNKLFLPKEKKTKDDFPGVYYEGVQYYDLKRLHSINNTGIAQLVDLLKSLLEQDVEVKFVNVSEKIKHKIKSLGLDHILYCS